MPSWLLNKENHLKILSLFFIVLLIIIPSFVYNWYEESTRYDEHGLLNEDKGKFFRFMNENTIMKVIPELIA
jgi:preprotein translocase subunit Sec63